MGYVYAVEYPDIGFAGIRYSEEPVTDQPEGGRYVRIESEEAYRPGATAACYDAEGRLIREPEPKPSAEDLARAEQNASRLMFRTLAMTDMITPADAVDHAVMFPAWGVCIGQRAEPGSYWRHGDKLYRVNAGQGHRIQVDWAPDQAVSLFSLASNPADEWPEWIQPTGAHNAYAKGDKVTYKGKRYISKIEANVWAPDAYPAGWEVQ